MSTYEEKVSENSYIKRNNDVTMQKSVSLPEISNKTDIGTKSIISEDLFRKNDSEYNNHNKFIKNSCGENSFAIEKTISLDEAFKIPTSNRSRKLQELERIERMKKNKRNLSRNKKSRSKIRSRLGNWTPYTPSEGSIMNQSILQIV